MNFKFFFFIIPILLFVKIRAADIDQKKCENIRKLLLSPGNGFDALESKDMALIFDLPFNHCEETSDNKFAIRDGLDVNKIDEYHLDVDIFTDWSEYVPATAKNLKIESSKINEFSRIDGSFTRDYETIKNAQLFQNFVIIRVSLRHIMYRVTVNMETPLQKKFHDKLDNIASEIKESNYKSARFLADTIIRDYGTHFIQDIDIGAIFIRDDYFDLNFVGNDSRIIKSAAKASFCKAYNFSIENQLVSDISLGSYEKLRKSSSMFTIGGTPYQTKLTLREWETGLFDNLAVIDHNGIGLDSALRIMKNSLDPDYYEESIKYIQNAIQKYYRLNIHKGCSVLEAPLIDSTVNFNAGSICYGNYENQFLGGFYQTCSLRGLYEKNYCNNYTFANELSGASSCPLHYDDHLAIQMQIIHFCPEISTEIIKKCSVDVSTHVCLSSIEPSELSKTYLFGGVYSPFIKNIITNAKNCPPKFDAIGVLGDGHLFVCVSEKKVSNDDLQMFSFGGLCRAFDKCPNSLCPPGYSQHFGTLYQEMEIYYCAKIVSSEKVELLRPPYLELQEKEIISTIVKNKPLLVFFLLNVILGFCLDLGFA